MAVGKRGNSGLVASRGASPSAGRRAGRAGGAAGVSPRFLAVLKKLLGRGEGMEGNAAAWDLKSRLLDHLERDCPSDCICGPLKALARRHAEGQPHGETATALKLLRALSDVAARPEGLLRPDSLLRRVEESHFKIEAGQATVLAQGADGVRVSGAVAGRMRHFKGVPEVEYGRLKPARSGLVRVGGAEGVFVEFAACRPQCQPLTLLVFESRARPRSPTVEYNGHSFWVAREGRHTLVAWRGAGALLYVLVEHCALKNALAMAELLRGG